MNKETPSSIPGTLSFKELVDIGHLDKIFQMFSAATGFTTGLVSYPDQELLIGTGWRDICTKFHRVCPESEKYCIASNQYLTNQLKELNQCNICPCEHGLVDGATPIIIDGWHAANLFTGQILFERPDIERFKKQAEEFGYDTDAYLEALNEVPVVSKERFLHALSFLSELAVIIAKGGLQNQKLNESEERYRTLVEHAPEAVVVLDCDTGCFADINENAVRLYGLKKEELLQVGPSDLSPACQPDGRSSHEKAMEKIQLALEGKTPVFEWMHRNAAGEEIECEIRLVRLPSTDRKLVRGSVLDISERKRMEKELLKNRKLESVGILAGGIAHDFNNLLTAVLGNVSLAKSLSRSNEDIQKCLTGAEKASLRAKDLTQQLLTFSKGGTPVKEAASIQDLVKETVSFVLRGTNVQCQFDFSPGLWRIYADRGQFSQVIQNIVINANQAMPEGGSIDIAAENVTLAEDQIPNLTRGDYIKLSISDRGTGIPEEYIPKIFDPYFTTKQTGSGLGLATVYSIITKHDGAITVESEYRRGTTFSIYLPAFKKPLPSPDREISRESISGQGRVLVLDDDELVRSVAGLILQQLGYEADFARTGAETIEKYQRALESGTGYDVVIMDLTIPGGMGGKEAVKILKDIDPNIKAIVSSGYSNDPVMSNFRSYGFRGVIGKPYRMEEFGKTVQSVINGESA